MEKVSVVSPLVASVGYDSHAKLLEIGFVTGTAYRYSGVSRHVFEEIVKAESVGSYFNAHVLGAYPYEWIPGSTGVRSRR